MSLIRCSECQKEISDKAPSCPNCGNPISLHNAAIQAGTSADKPIHIEPELTNKSWKTAKLASWAMIVMGIIFLSQSQGNPGNPVLAAFSGLMIFIGVVALIVSHIGAWYADKRTR